MKRVVSSELLRRAFLNLDNPPEHTGASTHGAFGATDDWELHKPHVSNWLANSNDVKKVTERLCAFAPLEENGKQEVLDYCRNKLCNEISRVVNDDRFIQQELSERLASAGLLPMFGFPTRVRNLFKGDNRNITDVDEATISDRPLDHAIWSFSPGAEIPKDKRLHTACGFVLLKNHRGSIVRDPDPLGTPLKYSKCIDPECGAVQAGQSEYCNVCDQQAEDFNLFQPKGFLTTRKPIDYDGQRQRGSNISPPIFAHEPSFFPGDKQVGAAQICLSERKPIALVNDNLGRFFEFQQNYNSVIVPDSSLYRENADIPRSDGPITSKSAIGAVFTTDVMSLFIKSDNDIGIDGVLDTKEQFSARPALASFSELLRMSISEHLDIDPSELRVGLQKIRCEECVSEYIFMADTLENGAGYVRKVFQDGLRDIVKEFYLSEKSRWTSSAHSNCDSSCPDCLRNYGNRMTHHLLDWRLALDISELMLGKELDTSRWLDKSEETSKWFINLCSQHEINLQAELTGDLISIVSENSKAIVLCHPLWHFREGCLNERQERALIELRGINNDVDIKFVDIRKLTNKPQEFIVLMSS